jgi:hypothetical protein
MQRLVIQDQIDRFTPQPHLTLRFEHQQQHADLLARDLGAKPGMPDERAGNGSSSSAALATVANLTMWSKWAAASERQIVVGNHRLAFLADRLPRSTPPAQVSFGPSSRRYDVQRYRPD